MKDLLTASRMSSFLFCQRKHFWRYEIGLRRQVDADALRFGTAWHTAMESRWNKASLDVAFQAAISDKTLDKVQAETLSGMLVGYYSLYQDDPVKTVHPEVEFRYPLAGSRKFEVAGKIDGLCVMQDDSLALLEHKTAGCDIGPDSDYWIRLRGNPQVMQYILAARQLGWDVSRVIYDVARKPAIRVKQNETPEQFGERLAIDTKERPEFYFARRDVPILEDDLAEFEIQRNVLARQILTCRAEARRHDHQERGFPRNIGEMTCKLCDYSSFCLQNVIPDLNHPPAGFTVGEIHTELTV